MEISAGLVATKGNLIAAKYTLRLAKQGYELMDKKRMILLKESMALGEKAEEIRNELGRLQAAARKSLQSAVIELGGEYVRSIGESVEEEKAVCISSRSVMGGRLPVVELVCEVELTPPSTVGVSCTLDEAYIRFNEIKKLLVKLSELENTIYRLELNIKRTSKRANALENITIPKYEARIKDILGTLEERERDEFVRGKVVKRGKASME